LIVAHCGDSNCAYGRVGVLLNNGDGTFRAPETFLSGGDLAVALAIGDVNGDGKPDVTVIDFAIYYVRPVVSVLLGNGDGSLQPAQIYDSGNYSCFNAGYCPVSIALADIDGDGKLDVVLPGDLLLGNGDGSFQDPLDYNSGCARGQIALADLDNDGRADVSAA